MLERNLNQLGHETERINIVDHSIHDCVGCNFCFQEKTRPVCAQKDDAMLLFDRMIAADVVVYASPLYAFSFPAQMKAFVDRHYCLVTNPGTPEQSSLIEGKRVALLITCSDPLENNTDLVLEMFDRVFLKLKCIVSGKFVVESSSAPDFGSRAEETGRVMAGTVTTR